MIVMMMMIICTAPFTYTMDKNNGDWCIIKVNKTVS